MKFLSILLFLITVKAQASQVVDNGSLFSLAAKDQALKALEEIEERTGTETIIETIAFANNNFPNDAAKNTYFENILLEKAKKRKANGLFVLICRTPGRVQVQFDKRLGKTKADQDVIVAAAVAQFRKENWDAGLMAIVQQADRALTVAPVVELPQPEPVAPVAQRPIAQPQPAVTDQTSNEGASIVLIIGLIFLAAIVVVGIIYWMRPKDIEMPDESNEELYRPTTRKKSIKTPVVSTPAPVGFTGATNYMHQTGATSQSNNNDLVTAMMLGSMINQQQPEKVVVVPPIYERPDYRSPPPSPKSSSSSSSSSSHSSKSDDNHSTGFSGFDSGFSSGGFDSGSSSGGDF